MRQSIFQSVARIRSGEINVDLPVKLDAGSTTPESFGCDPRAENVKDPSFLISYQGIGIVCDTYGILKPLFGEMRRNEHSGFLHRLSSFACELCPPVSNVTSCLNMCLHRQAEHTMDDKDLIASIASGDRSAMRDLYTRYNNAVYAFAVSRCGNAELASDCVHDTMLDVWRTASRFAGQSSVKTWLFSIARNKLVDALRKRGKLSFVEEVPESADTAPDPEAAAIAASERQRLHICLKGLKDVQRSAIRLAFLEDLTYPEIAEIEAVPVGTIKTRIFHAKQALMRCLTAGLRR